MKAPQKLLYVWWIYIKKKVEVLIAITNYSNTITPDIDRGTNST